MVRTGKRQSAKLSAKSYERGSDSSSSDDEGWPTRSRSVGRDSYHSLNLGEGLRDHVRWLRASAELTRLMSVGSSSLSRQELNAACAHVLLAIECCPSGPKEQQALIKLTRAAVAALPRKRGEEIQRAHRKSSIALSRNRSGTIGETESFQYRSSASDAEADPNEELVCLVDLPQLALERILRMLDAQSLARVCTLSRAWHKLATDDAIWRRHVLLHLPEVAAIAPNEDAAWFAEWRRSCDNVGPARLKRMFRGWRVATGDDDGVQWATPAQTEGYIPQVRRRRSGWGESELGLTQRRFWTWEPNAGQACHEDRGSSEGAVCTSMSQRGRSGGYESVLVRMKVAMAPLSGSARHAAEMATSRAQVLRLCSVRRAVHRVVEQPESWCCETSDSSSFGDSDSSSSSATDP